MQGIFGVVDTMAVHWGADVVVVVAPGVDGVRTVNTKDPACR